MTIPNEVIVDVQTNEVIINEVSAEKLAELAEEGARIEAQRLAELEAAKNAKAALLNKLGITEEEAKLLLS